MRIVPLLTAMLVSVALYLVVFERDRLMSFARADAAEGPPVADGTQGTVAAAEVTGAPGVVAVHSAAQTVDNAVILRGQTRANRQVEMRAQTSSTVISEPLRKGAFVEAGDVLCQLDPGSREASLAEAQARLAEARSRVPETRARLTESEARLAEARINENAAVKLSAEGYASETRVVSSRAAVRSAEAAIASATSGLEATESGIKGAMAAVQAAEREIDRLTIKAPFKGVLESDTAELGSLLQPGSLCATVIQLDPIKLVGYVPEAEIDRVRIGAQAGAKLATGQTVLGKVIFTSRSADPTTRTFEIEIEVPNPDLTIRDGQTAEIGISAAGTKAHRLPQSALTLNNDGQLGVRVVGDGNVVGFVPVRLLRDDVGGIWIGGLPDMADVIIVGQDFVIDGVVVAPTYREITQ